MTKKGPKTAKGMRRKILTGDGRKKPETFMKEQEEKFRELASEKKKKKR